MHSSNIILMAEDDPDDRLFIYEALAENHLGEHLRCVEDGEELLDYLHHRGKYGKNLTDGEPAPRPSIILLDLNMPKMNGREALKQIRADPDFHTIPVIVMTTSYTEEELLLSYNLGASSFIPKPMTFWKLVAVMKTLKEYWFKTVKLPLLSDELNLRE